MGKPKKQTSARKTGLRRSHLLVKLARMVNAKSPIKAYTTKRESGKKKTVEVAKRVAKKVAAKK
jgi:ribosomal protein L32